MFTFEHAHLVCADVAGMERFLIDVMGGRLRSSRVTNGVLNVEIDMGGGLVFLRDLAPDETPQPRRPGETATLNHLGFSVTDLGAALARLRGHGLEVLAGPLDWREDLAFAYVAGPEGLVLELLDRRPRQLRNAEPTQALIDGDRP